MKNKCSKIILSILQILILLSLNFIIKAQPCPSGSPTATQNANGDWQVCNYDQLNDAISKVSVGENIIMANGIWKDVVINFNSQGGTLNSPITLKAKTPGAVFIEGCSRLLIDGEYLKVEGLTFRNNYSGECSFFTGTLPITGAVKFTDRSKKCSLTNCVIDGFNYKDAVACSHGSINLYHGTEYWIVIRGLENEVGYCSFINWDIAHNDIESCKPKADQVISVPSNGESPFGKHKIHHNYFGKKYFPDVNKNNKGEAIVIGAKAPDEHAVDMDCRIYNNFFNEYNGEEAEVISIKCSNNKIYHNTILNSNARAQISIVAGNNNSIYGNFIINEDYENNEESSGILINGKYTSVYNNYLEGMNAVDGAILLSCQWGVSNCLIAFNSLFNCQGGINTPPSTEYCLNSPGGNDIVVAFNLVHIDEGIYNNHLSFQQQYTNSPYFCDSSSCPSINPTTTIYEKNEYFPPNSLAIGINSPELNESSGVVANSNGLWHPTLQDCLIYTIDMVNVSIVNNVISGIIPGLNITDDIDTKNRDNSCFPSGSQGLKLYDLGCKEILYNEYYSEQPERVPYKISDVGREVGASFVIPAAEKTVSNEELELTKLYPNPSHGVIYIQPIQDIERLMVFHPDGRLMYETYGLLRDQKHSIQLDDIDPGIYMIHLFGIEDTHIVKKLILMR